MEMIFSEGLFCPLAAIAYQVTNEDLKEFKQKIFNKKNPDIFYIRSEEGIFLVNKSTLEFKIVVRNYTDNDFENSIIDCACMRLYKIARHLGFKVSLENKYCN